MSFPLEGWQTSAAVVLAQQPGGRIVGEVHGAGPSAAKAWRQALATFLSTSTGRATPSSAAKTR